MRVLVIGDLHARPALLSEFSALAKALARQAEASRPDVIVLTGDLLHEHARVHTGALNAVLDLIRELAARAADLYVLIGNHDLPSNQCFLEAQHAFNALKAWPRVHVADQVVHDAARSLVFVPYVPAGRFVEALSNSGYAWREGRAIFAHQDFRGARQGTFVSAHGDAWHPDWPLVISGHFHGHQWPRPNVCYVGSPVAHDFGDEASHTISLFTWEDPEWREERLDLGLPARRTVTLPLADALAFAPPPATLIRLIVTGTAAELAAFRASREHSSLAARVTKLVLRSMTSAALDASAPRVTYAERLAALVQGEAPPVQRLFAALGGPSGGPCLDQHPRPRAARAAVS
jgi:hypothetical protein